MRKLAVVRCYSATTRWSGRAPCWACRAATATARRGEADYPALAVETLAALGFDTDKIRSDAWLG